MRTPVILRDYYGMQASTIRQTAHSRNVISQHVVPTPVVLGQRGHKGLAFRGAARHHKVSLFAASWVPYLRHYRMNLSRSARYVDNAFFVHCGASPDCAYLLARASRAWYTAYGTQTAKRRPKIT